MSIEKLTIEELSPGDYEQEDYKIKIIVVGDSGVGKTNLINRFASDKFDTNSKATIGVEFVYKTLKINKEVIKVEVWDTAGQERYRAITSSYYKGAKGAIIVYDITNEDSFNNVESWMNEVTKKGKTDMQFLLVGNKKDLINDRKVTEQKGIDKAKELNMNLFEASALEKTNVNEAFINLIKIVYKDIARKEIEERKSISDNKISQGIDLKSMDEEEINENKESFTCCLWS
jgi:Ras-related protein Rab-11A